MRRVLNLLLSGSLASALVLIGDEVVADWHRRGGELGKENEDDCLLIWRPFRDGLVWAVLG
jgi:hypothetical protein